MSNFKITYVHSKTYSPQATLHAALQAYLHYFNQKATNSELSKKAYHIAKIIKDTDNGVKDPSFTNTFGIENTSAMFIALSYYLKFLNQVFPDTNNQATQQLIKRTQHYAVVTIFATCGFVSSTHNRKALNTAKSVLGKCPISARLYHNLMLQLKGHYALKDYIEGK